MVLSLTCARLRAGSSRAVGGWVSLAFARVPPWWEGVYRCTVCIRALACAVDVACFADVCAGVA
jgi:hypothetical protein